MSIEPTRGIGAFACSTFSGGQSTRWTAIEALLAGLLGRYCGHASLTEFKTKGKFVQSNAHGKTDENNSRLFLNASQVGEQLGLRKSRVYELAAQGLLPNVRLGRRIWFPVRGLDALADAAIQVSRNRVLALDGELRTN